MIPDIIELNFPKIDGKQYATLTQATATLADMGEKTITTQVKIDGEIVPDFSFDWAVEFQGEKYIMPLRIPQGAKENTSLNSTIDLTFQHWAIYQLKRWPFVTIQQIAAGTYMPDEEVTPVQLNLKDFCILFGQVLEYYYGNTITIDLNPAWQYKQEATRIEISHTKIWNVLIDAFHGKYGVRWEIKAASDNNNTVKGGERYVIRVGYPTTEVDHIFEYGFEGGLLKVERQVQSEEIRNILKGRGGETNIPFRYFKDTDPNNKDFRPDPDWVEELANIPFTNLMPATFRSYVQGWKAAHISKYPGYTAVGEANAYAPWAYRKGYTDTKFHPVEFVADEITINSTAGDKQVEILPGYSPYVKKGSSLDKYGPLPDTLDNNADIYPTLQGTGLDIAVAVEQIKSDDVADSTENDTRIEDKIYPDIIKKNVPQGHATAADASKRTYFSVPSDKKANIEGYAGAKAYNPKTHEDKSALIAELDYTIKVFNATTGAERSASGIPAGDWYFTVEYSFNNTSTEVINITCSFNSVKITSATPDGIWKSIFDVWIPNVWGGTLGVGSDGNAIDETHKQYAMRVWKPVLGDREKNTAKMVFTSGMLAHEDYEFTIVDYPVFDTSKTYKGMRSHWRVKLAKSDAELEATGLYVPSTQKQGKAGDTFVFVGTEMTHVPYVVDAEIRLDDGKKDQLGEVKEIKPTAVVTTDRVRLNNEGKPNALINQLRVGNSLRLFDKRFFNEEGKAYETLYLQSITYTYREPSSDDAALNPDVEIVLGNEYTISANPVSMMQGEISALQKQVGSISNIEQIVRAVGDKLYLRKDGISDRSLSPTQFFSLMTSGDFRAGMIGGAGWGFYKDENGNWVLEVPRLNVRQDMTINTLVINQAEGRGGMEIDTAAYIDGVTWAEETADGYVCYFNPKEGTVANLFHVDDVAYCNRWTPENTELKFYKRRVTAVGADSITLTKALSETERPSDWPDSGVNGTGIPAEGDNIIHFGNYTDKTRQYVKVRDVVGGGYERYIEELNSVTAEGVEYYFVGKQAGESRWFVGNKDLVPYSGKGDGSYIEYINRRFNLNNVTLSVNSTIGDKTFEEYIKEVSPPVTQEDIEGFVNNIVGPTLDGIQDQLDGVIESFFGFGAPTLTNYPANEWTTDEARKAHAKDTYTDRTEYIDDTTTPTAGQSWKWQYTSPTDYGWVKIADSDAVKALLDAARAQDTADGKRRIFTQQPVPPYDEGDLWVNATYGSQYSNDILRCVTQKANGAAFSISDWTLASKYTDDTVAIEARDRLSKWAQDGLFSPPEFPELKLELVRIESTKNEYDQQYQLYGDLVNKLDGASQTKATFDTAYNSYHTILNDILTADRDEDGCVPVPADFAVKMNAYYAARANMSAVLANLAKLASVNAVADLDYLKEALRQKSITEGGLFLTSLIALGVGDPQHPDDISKRITWSGINGIIVPDKGTRSISTWYGGSQTDKEDYYEWDESVVPPRWTLKSGVTQAQADAARIATGLVRMDGSGYFANGNLWWDTTGNLHADPLSFFVGENSVGNVLGLFKFNPSNTAAFANVKSVTPQRPFTSLWLGSPDGAHMIELTYDATHNALRIKGNMYADGWLSFRGANDGSGGSAVAGAANLSDLKDVSLGSLVAGQALVWNGAKWVNSTIATSGLDELSLANYLSSHGYATQSWANGVFVSKSGDTMTGHLTLLAHDMYLKNSTDGSQYVCYGFKNTANAIIAQIGYHNTGKRVIINPVGSSEPWVDAVGKYNLIIGNNELKYNTHSLLHTGNYTATLDDRYLKLTGGTVTGLLKISFEAATPFIVNNPVVNNECGIAFNLSNTGKGWVGYNPTLGAVLYNYANGKYLGIKDDGTPHYQGYTLWHSGNDGHNSGLDADTVDGVQCSDMLHFVALQPQNLDANSIVTTGSCYVPRGGMNNSSWNGYTFTNFPTSKPQGGFMLMNLAEGNYRRQLYTAYNNSNLYVRYYYFNGTAVTWSPWRTLAFTDSTVANANSLGGKAAAQYVTTDTAQEITGIKTFTNYTKIEQALMFKGAPDGVYFATSANGNLNISAHTNYSYVKNIGYITPSGSLTMGSFIKSGGTAAQFLKADGSVDSRAFLVLDGQQESTGPSLDLNAFNTAVFTRIRTGEQTTTNCPFAGYGQLLNLWTTGKVSALQIATKSSDIYFRSKDGAAATITSNWHRILHSGNYSSILDDRYVNASGDTMTGPLAVREIDAPDGNGLLAYSGSWTGVDFSSQYGVGTINKQGVIRSGNASLIHYRHGAGNATIWDSLNDGHGSGLNADMLDGLHLDSVRGYRVEHPAINSSLAVGNVPFNALGMQHGTPIYNDPEFASGNNGVAVYNNAVNGNVTITRIADNQASANSSGYILQIKVTGPAEPWTGGFVQSIQSRANAVFMQIFRAKIPVGYNVNVNSNQMGANYSDVWITSTAGTGKWEWYARVVYCGASGSFSLGGYVSLKGANATAANPLYWYLSHCQVWDLSKNNYGTLRAKFADALSASRSIWGQSFDGSGNVSGNMTGVGTITSTYYSLHNISNNPYLKFNVGGKITYVQALSTGIGVGPTYTALFVTNDSKVGIGTASPSEKLSVAGWVGTIGNTGWYNITHGGGWYMSDSGWVRTYNNKGIYSGTGEIRNNSYFNRTVYEGSSWNNGYGAYNVSIFSNLAQTPLMVAYRNGYAVDVTGANRLFALELLNNGAEMHFAFGGSTKFSMTNTGVFFANGGIWTNGYMSFRGQNTSSDARQKRILRDIHVPLTTIAKAPNIVFSWLDNGKLDMGSIAQYWQKHLPLSVYVRPNGYLGMDYSKVALACVISMASELLGVKDDVSMLKQEVRQLKHENQQLKQQIDRMERRIA